MTEGISKKKIAQTQKGSDYPAPFVLDMDTVQNALGASFAEVVQDVSVLRLAQNYLNLCADIDNEAISRVKSNRSSARVPSGLEKTESGLNVLCAAYVQAKQSKNEKAQKDIRKNILSLSSIYQQKTSEAYFSASNIVFDAYGLMDKPALLKQLVGWRDALQQVHFAWPVEKETENMSSFYEKVELYGRQLGIDGRVLPEKRSSFTNVLPHSLTAHSRCA